MSMIQVRVDEKLPFYEVSLIVAENDDDEDI
ncbi:hypothetical protein BDD26_1465 [Xenorhabdus cabanillasii]|uniref:Uncharacterized protein n=1 Tax=Xenorhabdus cabanillasii TaxID=351673 RepID=A0A3D9UQ04_9GAMM|nr:transcriptional regulator [Xenorhabdus cabanillasii JM26]REF26781.1 hypothetical protein BDD26_1465 [Xenorhabdus cabanillasii]